MMVTKCKVRKLFFAGACALAVALLAAAVLAFGGAAVQANAAVTQAETVRITPYENMTLATDCGNGVWELKNAGDCGFFVDHALEDGGMISFRLRFGDDCTYQSGDRFLFAKVNPGGEGDGLFGIRTDGKVHGVAANSDSGNNIIHNTPFVYPFEYVKDRQTGAGSLEYDFAYYRQGNEVYLLTKYASASAYIVSAKHPCAESIPNLNFYNTGNGDKHMFVSNVTYTADATAFYEKASANGVLTNGPSIQEDDGTYTVKFLGSSAIAGGGNYGALVGNGVFHKNDGKFTIRAKAEGKAGAYMMYGFYMMTADGKMAQFGAYGSDSGFFTNAFTASLLSGNGFDSRAIINKQTAEGEKNWGITGGFTETGHTWNIGDTVALYMQAVIDNDTVEYYVSNTGFDNLTKVIQINLRTYFQNVTTDGGSATWEGASKDRFPAETGLMKVGVYKFGDGGNAAEFSEISVDYEGYHTNKTAVAAKEATCTEEGNIAHQTCDICGEHFDMQGNAVSAESVIIAKTPLTKVEAVEATCSHAGNKAYYKCDDCGKCFSDSNGNTQIEASSVILPALPHAMRKLDAQQSTCKTAGNIEYYHCEDCDKYYSDQSGTNEITLQEATLPLAAHTLEKIEGTSSTKDEAGNIEYYKCSECGKYFRDAEGKTEITLAQTVTPKKVSGCHSALGSVTGVGMAVAALAACICAVTFRKKRSA